MTQPAAEALARGRLALTSAMPAWRARSGAVGIHIGGTACRAAAGFEEHKIRRGVLPRGGVDAICTCIVDAVHELEGQPRFVVIGTPGKVNPETGEVAGAANLGSDWTGTVPLGTLVAERLQCEVEVRNDAAVALAAERRLGALVAVNDGALITLSTGVGVALLLGGREQTTELGHSVLQFGGPPCIGRPHHGCFESYLGGWALPLRYKEWRPDFAGSAARDIPEDVEFWTDYGTRLGELVVQLCLMGHRIEVISLIGQIALARGKSILPATEARLQRETSVLGAGPRRLRVTPLGDDVAVLGALIVARDLLYPFGSTY